MDTATDTDIEVTEIINVDAPPIPTREVHAGRGFCDWVLDQAKKLERLPEVSSLEMQKLLRVIPHLVTMESFDRFVLEELGIKLHHAPTLSIDLEGYDKPAGNSATPEQNKEAHKWMRQRVANSMLEQLPEQAGLTDKPKTIKGFLDMINRQAAEDSSFHTPLFIECLEYWPHVRESESLLNYLAQYFLMTGELGLWGAKAPAKAKAGGIPKTPTK